MLSLWWEYSVISKVSMQNWVPVCTFRAEICIDASCMADPASTKDCGIAEKWIWVAIFRRLHFIRLTDLKNKTPPDYLVSNPGGVPR